MMDYSKKTPLNIVIAEDDPDDRHVFSMALKEVYSHTNISGYDNGYDVMNALLGKEVPSCDIIFLDINMPKMNGLDCLRELRENIQFNTIPIIMLTTSSTKEDVMETFYAGATRFITKPPTYRELLNLFDQTVKLLHEGKLRKTDLFNYVLKPNMEAVRSQLKSTLSA